MSTDDGACPHTAIPKRLHRNGRPVDNTFSDAEWLYCRCRTEGYKGPSPEAPFPLLDADGLIHEQHIRTQRQSVVRERYSKGYRDALYDGDSGLFLTNEAVFGFQFEKTHGATHQHGQVSSRSFEIRLEHVPTPCIYPHAEVCVIQQDHKDGTVTESVPGRVKGAVKLWVIDTVRTHAQVFRYFPESAA